MANPLTPQGTAWQNIVRHRTQVDPNVGQSPGQDPNFLQNIEKYKGGREAWWARHGSKEYGADILSGAAFLQKPGEWQFEAEKALEGINKMASAIYDPQRAQLQALAGLQKAQYQEQRITTAEQFEDLLRQEEESFNRRGAFFSSGAMERGTRILEQKGRTLGQLDIQNAANQAQMLAQQGMLSAQQAEYVQQRLTSAESGAYARWRDKVMDYRAERQWLMDTYTAERDYQMQYYMWKKDYKLRKKSMA